MWGLEVVVLGFDLVLGGFLVSRWSLERGGIVAEFDVCSRVNYLLD